MGLLITSRKFFYENKNGSDFSLNLGDFTNFLRPSVAGFCKAVYEFTLTNFVSVRVSEVTSFDIVLVSGDRHTIKILGSVSGAFWEEWKEGFVFDVFDITGSVKRVTDGTVISISGDTLTFDSSTVTVGSYDNADAKVVQEWTDFNFFYRNFGDDFNSPIDNSPQKFIVDLGSPQSTSLVTGNSIGSGAWQNGSFKLKFVSDSDDGAIQLFEFEHIFEVLPYFESNQIADITNRNTVVPYIDSIINYDIRLEAYNIANVSSVFVNEDTQQGQVTWYDSAKYSVPTSYSVTSIVYTDTVTSKILTKLTTENKVQVVVVIADNGGAPFVASDPFTIKHSLLLEDYTDSTTQLYDEIWLNENLRSTLGAGAAANTIITNLTGVRDSAVQITITFDIELTASQKLQVENGFNYILLAYLEDSTLTNLTTNETPLILDINNYTVNSDVDGFVSETSAVYNKQNVDIGSGGTTDYDGTIEDGVVATVNFTINPTVDKAILNNLAFLVLAYDTVNNVWFEIQRNDIGINQNIFVTDSGTSKKLQQIELNTTRGFDLKAGNQFNFKKITTGTFANPVQPYTFNFGFKINWEAFESLPSASTDFYDATKENNGLNLNTSNYSGAQNREIRFAREYIYTIDGVKTTKVIFSPDSDIKDYGESTTGWSVAINTENDAAFDLEEKFENRKDTTIVALFTDGNTQTDINSFEAVIIAKEKNSSDFFEISTLRAVLEGGILKPITGTKASKALVGGDFEVRCKLDFTKLANPNYSISARIYFDVIFSDLKALELDGINEWVKVTGSEASYNFIHQTGIFTLWAWVKFADIASSGFAPVMGNNSGTTAQHGFFFAYDGFGKLRFSITKAVGGTPVLDSLSTLDIVDDNNYHLLMASGDGTNVFFTVDNVTETGSGTMVSFSGSNATKPLGLGRLDGTAFFIEGIEDDIAIANIEFSAAEKTEVWNAGCPSNLATHSKSANIVSWWRMGDLDDDETLIKDRFGSDDGIPQQIVISDFVTDVPCP